MRDDDGVEFVRLREIDTTSADIEGELEAELGPVESVFDMVLFFGGGAAIFKDVISSNKLFQVIEDPEFANVRGFESAAKACSQEEA